jgi:quercetin dioxygenase-like cupin family protein
MDERQREEAAANVVEPGLYGLKLVDGDQGANRVSLVRGWMKPGGRHSPHTHEVEEAVIFLSGRGEVDLEGRRVVVGPGDLLHIPPHIVHSTFNPGDEDLCFVAAFADSLIASEPHGTGQPPGQPRQAGALRRAAASLLLGGADRQRGAQARA